MRRAQQVSQQQQRRPIGPVKILEDHQQRLYPGDRRDQRGNRLEEPVPPALRVGLDRFVDDGHPAGQRCNELRQFPHAIHIG